VLINIVKMWALLICEVRVGSRTATQLYLVSGS